MGAVMAQDDKTGAAKDVLSRWGRWARRDGVARLGMPTDLRFELKGKFHEGDFPLEEKVDRVVAALIDSKAGYDLSARVLKCYYVERNDDGSAMSFEQIAGACGCGTRKVREEFKFALGYVSACCELGIIS